MKEIRTACRAKYKAPADTEYSMLQVRHGNSARKRKRAAAAESLLDLAVEAAESTAFSNKRVKHH